MRILFDARSVRTPAGAYVFGGLTSGWLRDPRVESVVAAVPLESTGVALPAGVEPLAAPRVGWLQHIRTELPRLADAARADVVFVPNGLPPRDPRVVIYFQDLYHFRLLLSPGKSLGARASNVARALWRARAGPDCLLAVAVSTDIHREVVRRLPIPTIMIPNGVEVSGVQWAGDENRIVVMGGRGGRKGEEVAIRAWSQLAPADRGALRLDVLGVEPASRLAELWELAHHLGVGDSTELTGTLARDEYLERVAGGTLAISCSRLEAFGLPVAEALVLGAPVLASDLPSHVELVERAGAGRTFLNGSADSLAGALRAILAGDAPARLSSAPTGWSWEDRAREHVDAYLMAPADAPIPIADHVRD